MTTRQVLLGAALAVIASMLCGCDKVEYPASVCGGTGTDMCFGDNRTYFGDSFRHEVKTDASLTKIRMIESWSRYAFLWGLFPLPFIGEWTPQGAELTYDDNTVLTGGKMQECGASCGWFPWSGAAYSHETTCRFGASPRIQGNIEFDLWINQFEFQPSYFVHNGQFKYTSETGDGTCSLGSAKSQIGGIVTKIPADGAVIKGIAGRFGWWGQWGVWGILQDLRVEGKYTMGQFGFILAHPDGSESVMNLAATPSNAEGYSILLAGGLVSSLAFHAFIGFGVVGVALRRRVAKGALNDPLVGEAS